jgi:hypothetical protein
VGFEKHGRPGLIEVASKIALKFGVIYSMKRNVFDGEAERVAKASKALGRWEQEEWLRNRNAV